MTRRRRSGTLLGAMAAVALAAVVAAVVLSLRTTTGEKVRDPGVDAMRTSDSVEPPDAGKPFEREPAATAEPLPTVEAVTVAMAKARSRVVAEPPLTGCSVRIELERAPPDVSADELDRCRVALVPSDGVVLRGTHVGAGTLWSFAADGVELEGTLSIDSDECEPLRESVSLRAGEAHVATLVGGAAIEFGECDPSWIGHSIVAMRLDGEGRMWEAARTTVTESERAEVRLGGMYSGWYVLLTGPAGGPLALQPGIVELAKRERRHVRLAVQRRTGTIALHCDVGSTAAQVCVRVAAKRRAVPDAGLELVVPVRTVQGAFEPVLELGAFAPGLYDVAGVVTGDAVLVHFCFDVELGGEPVSRAIDLLDRVGTLSVDGDVRGTATECVTVVRVTLVPRTSACRRVNGDEDCDFAELDVPICSLAANGGLGLPKGTFLVAVRARAERDASAVRGDAESCLQLSCDPIEVRELGEAARVRDQRGAVLGFGAVRVRVRPGLASGGRVVVLRAGPHEALVTTRPCVQGDVTLVHCLPTGTYRVVVRGPDGRERSSKTVDVGTGVVDIEL
jgi:hypothetical protein